MLSGCKEDPPDNPTDLSLAYNTAPKAFAGHDIWVLFPIETAVLNGSAIDDELNINKYLWRQIAGDPAVVIAQANYSSTRVLNLKKGDYQFEFSVTDAGNLTDKDTVALFVRDTAEAQSGELIFKNLEWTCPWFCEVEISCLPCHVPVGKAFKVFVKENANQWLEAVPVSNWSDNIRYAYEIVENSLFIFSGYSEGKAPDIKVVF